MVGLKSSVFMLGVLVLVVDTKVPDYIHVCRKNDPNLSKCIINSVNKLKPFLIKGIPELDVPPLEPFRIKDLSLKTGAQGVLIGATIQDVTVWGGSHFEVLDLQSDLSKDYFRFQVNVPYLRMKGKYEINSKILSLKIKGDGAINVNLTDFWFDTQMFGKRIQKDGKKHLVFTELKNNCTIGGGKIYMENLFNGDKILSRATHDVINDQMDLFYNAIKPGLEESLQDLFLDLANKIVRNFEYEELFP